MLWALVLVSLTAFAALAFTTGEFEIVGGRKSDATTNRAIGWVLVGGIVLTAMFGSTIGSIVGFGTLLLSLLLGLMLSSKSVTER